MIIPQTLTETDIYVILLLLGNYAQICENEHVAERLERSHSYHENRFRIRKETEGVYLSVWNI